MTSGLGSHTLFYGLFEHHIVINVLPTNIHEIVWDVQKDIFFGNNRLKKAKQKSMNIRR